MQEFMKSIDSVQVDHKTVEWLGLFLSSGQISAGMLLGRFWQQQPTLR